MALSDRKGWSAFLEGWATLGNISGKDDSLDVFLHRSDAESMRSDWNKVGGDIASAMLTFKSNYSYARR